MALYILSLVFGAIGTAIDLFSKMMKSKKFIIVYMTLASLFFVVSYICLRNPLSAIANGINLGRGIIYLMLIKENKSYKHYIAPVFILLTAFIIPFIFLWTGPMDLFLLFATVIATIALAFKSTLIIRIGLILNSSLWAIYNLYIKSYINLICNLGSIAICIGAIIVYNVILIRRKKAREAELTDEPPQANAKPVEKTFIDKLNDMEDDEE